MIKRSGRLLVEVLGILVAGFVLLVAAGAWRLHSGPLEIGFLTPILQDAMNRPEGPRLDIGTTLLRWQGFDRPLTLAATEVRIRDGEDGILARIPEMALSLDVAALVRGQLVPRRLVLVDPVLRVVRDEDGSLRYELGTDAASDPAVEPGEGADVFARLLDALEAPAIGPDSPSMAALEELRVSGGRVIVDDRALDRVWYAPRADIALSRTDGDLAVRFDGVIDHRGRGFDVMADARWSREAERLDLSARVSLDLAERRAVVQARTTWAPGRERITVDLDAEQVVPAALAGLDPVLAPLGAVVSPMQGRARVVLDERLEPVSADFAVTGASGRLDLAGLYEAPLTIAGLGAGGRVDFEGGRLRIDDVTIDLGGPTVTGSARVEDVGDRLDILATADIAGLPTDLLARYWPPGLGGNARDWVTTNLTRGRVDRARVILGARLPVADPAAVAPEALELVSLGGRIGFDGVRLTVLDGLPPITGLGGIATFDKASFTIEAGGGRLDDLDVPDGRIVIRGLDGDGQHTIDIDTVARGPVRTALEVLDSPGLEFASELGIDPASTAGDMSARLRFAFPLDADLLFEQVALSAAANIRDGTIGGLSLGLPEVDPEGPAPPITAIDAALTVDGQGLSMAGDAAYDGIPMRFEWSEPFAGPAGTRIRVTGRLDDEDRVRLGLPAIEAVSGPVGVDATYSGDGPGDRLDLALDLAEARLRLSEVGLDKPAGAPATLTAAVSIPADGPIVAAPVRLDAGAVGAAEGRIEIDPETGALLAARLDPLALGRSRATLDIARRPAGGFDVAIAGETLDLGPLLGEEDPSTIAAADPSEAPAADEAPADPLAGRADWPDMAVQIGLDRVILGPERALRSVSAFLVHEGGQWRRGDFSAVTPPDGTLSAALRPADSDPGTVIELRASDAGAAFAALDILPGLRGGSLEMAARRAPDGRLEGEAVMTDFVLVDAPVLARLLAALSLGGLQSLLTSDGLDFNRAETGFTYTGPAVEVADFTASGGALGITADGTIDLVADSLDIAGTIVPIYGLNQVIGAIPLLGDVLTGGGEGVFAFTYSATGPLDGPDVSVNPISVLAPGFLRTLFFLDADPPRDADGNIIDLPPRPERRERDD
ncbi:MAG: AsmA-like C-terminal domain-containing protein [Azospirillaceae bacterium]